MAELNICPDLSTIICSPTYYFQLTPIQFCVCTPGCVLQQPAAGELVCAGCCPVHNQASKSDREAGGQQGVSKCPNSPINTRMIPSGGTLNITQFNRIKDIYTNFFKTELYIFFINFPPHMPLLVLFSPLISLSVPFFLFTLPFFLSFSIYPRDRTCNSHVHMR